MLTVSSKAVADLLGILAMQPICGLSDDKAIWVHDWDNVEGVLFQVASYTPIGSSEQLLDDVLDDGTGDPLATVLKT